MFNLFKKYKENKKAEEQRQAQQMVDEMLKQQEEKRALTTELYNQSRENVTYIEALLKTMQSQFHNIKTRGSEKNKIRKENLKDNIIWYKIKLEEEKNMVSYYGVGLPIV